jgi:hypothetical protein
LVSFRPLICRFRAAVGAAVWVALLMLLSGAIVVSAAARAPKPKTCSGSLAAPGVLSGEYPNGAVIKGTCKVSAGVARVRRKLTLGPGSTLLANYGLHGSTLVVQGDVVVARGATLILGCRPPEASCLDAPSNGGRVVSSGRISGTLTASGALAVVAHHSTIGSVRQTGGGGGLSCKQTGPFEMLKNPVYSAYENVTVRRGLHISGMRSCWLGLTRDRVRRNVVLVGNKLADPDAIEILSNHVRGDLRCSANSRVWDSTETTHASEFPRKPKPNRVRGRRYGQCRLASPSRSGGPAGPGRF